MRVHELLAKKLNCQFFGFCVFKGFGKIYRSDKWYSMKILVRLFIIKKRKEWNLSINPKFTEIEGIGSKLEQIRIAFNESLVETPVDIKGPYERCFHS